MYTIEVLLRGSPLALSVCRKESADAEKLYQEITSALRGSGSSVMELTCEKETDKKITVLLPEVVAVQVSSKASGVAAGRSTGFFGQLAGQTADG
jgi:hypothetical protein